MKLEKKEIGNNEEIIKYQEKLCFIFPDDYVLFLCENNTVKVIDGYFYIPSLKETVLMDVFYGFNQPKSIDIISINHEYKDDIPEKSLLIGRDPGGAFILLINNNESNGIYFYDHQYFFEQSNDENNTYFISETFTEFLKILATTEQR